MSVPVSLAYKVAFLVSKVERDLAFAESKKTLLPTVFARCNIRFRQMTAPSLSSDYLFSMVNTRVHIAT